MQVTQAIHRAALIRPHLTAVCDGELRRSWRDFRDRVARMAGALRALGVERGDRVAVLALNGHRYLELYYAVPWAGAVVMPLNIRLAPPEILAQVADAEPRVLVVDDTFARMLPALSGRMPSVKHVVHMTDGQAVEGTRPYEELLAAAAPIEDAAISGEEVYGLFYTGGTTAASKGVMLTHANIVTNAYNVALGMTYGEGHVYLHAAPMFHLADSANTFAVSLCLGTHAFIPAFDVSKVLQAIQDYRVSAMLLVPTMINAVVNSPLVGQYDLSSLGRIMYGGSPMPTAVMAKARETLPCQLVQGYGMTETSPVLTFLPDEDHVIGGDEKATRRLRSAGIPVQNVEIRILDEEGRPLPFGEIGEICARGPNIMKGYWKKPEASAQALRGGFMHTGDLGYMDADGYVYLVDRAKDMIITGGENVYSVEVESALASHPAVLEAAVFGIPHADLGEQVHAAVVLKDGQRTTPDELIGHCRRLIAGYKCPKTVEIRPEALPKSGAGKILKRELRAPFWAGQERQIH
jgi:acyl-CoA synthetase (AMP-forming)/AMP-acid ligase II